MSNNIVTLGEICEFLDNKRVPVTESERKPGPYPYYGANGQQGWIDGFIFDEPLVLLAEDGGHFGSKEKPIAYKVTGKCWVNNHAHVLRPISHINIDYLHRILSYYDVTKYVNGTTRPKLTKGNADDIPIPLPTLSEQERIANLLAKSDRQRVLRRYARKLGETFLQSVFLEMFGNPIDNPRGLPIQQLGKIGKLDRGRSKNRPRNAPELFGGKYPFIQTGDVANSDGYIRTYQQTYSELGLKQSKLWKAGTLCITIAANIAKTSILTLDACFPDSIVGFIPNKEINIEYVQYWFSFVQKELEATAPQSAQKNINLEILRKMEIPIPAFVEQELFTRMVNRYDHLQLQQNEAVRQAEELFQALLQKSFGGEL